MAEKNFVAGVQRSFFLRVNNFCERNTDYGLNLSAGDAWK